MRTSPGPVLNGGLNLSMATNSDSGTSQEQDIESENRSLREEIARLQKELAENQLMLDQVLADYINSQCTIQEKNCLLDLKDEEILLLRENRIFPTEGPRLGPGIEGSRTQRTKQQQTEQRDAALRLEIDRLEAELAEEKRILVEMRDEWASAEARLEEAQQRCASLESQLQSEEKMRSEVSNNEAKVKELQDLVHFFKRNSERNSKRVTELTEKLEALTGAEC